MSTVKISELTELTSAATDDLLLITDSDANSSKKITKANLLSGYLTSYTETDPVVGAVTGLVKADGAGNISAAVAGTDYLTGSSTNTLTNKSGNISQWTNDSGYLTSFTETNDLTVAVTWANVPDTNITQSSVTQHEAALTITESQISDLGTYLEDGFSVTAGTLTTANITTADFGNYTVTETSGDLLFATGGNTKMKLDTNGGFTIL